MTVKSLQTPGKSGKNEQAEKLLTQRPGSKANVSNKETANMPFEHKYGDSTPEIKKQFKDSQEAAFRRLMRQSIRRGPFTKSEREVVLAFINHWFHHRNSTKGVVHPGRKQLARKAGVSIRTVSTVLDILRQEGALVATAHLNGLHGNATEYVVNTVALTELCGKKKADLAVYGVQNCTGTGCAKIARRISNVVPFLSQGLKVSGGDA